MASNLGHHPQGGEGSPVSAHHSTQSTAAQPLQDWRRDLLPRLRGLPLLPVGAGDGGKAPVDPKTGGAMKGWQTAAWTPEGIAATDHAIVTAVGMRCGPDTGRRVVFDLDGQTAIDAAVAAGCDWSTTWVITRPTAPDRMKVVFQVPEGMVPPTGRKAVRSTAEGEQVECFWGSGQVVVAGLHRPSGALLEWQGGPESIQPLPAPWLALWRSCCDKPAATAAKGEGRSAASEMPPRPPGALLEALRQVPQFRHGAGQYQQLLGLALRLRAEVGRDGAIALLRETCCGAIDDLDSYFSGADPTEISPGSVWPYLRDQWRITIRRDDLKRPTPTPPMDGEPFIPGDAPASASAPPQQPPQQAADKRSWKERNYRKRGYSYRAKCFERCVFIQATQERNQFRRRVRLLKAAKDLELQQFIKAAEIAPLILEAKDRGAGRTFTPLTAADRLAMVRPEVRWVLPDLIPEGDLTIIGGRPKVGKTRLSMAIAAAVLAGVPMLDLPAPDPSDRTVILVSDDQSDADTAAMLEAQNLWGHPRLIWSPHFRLAEHDLDKLLKELGDHPGALVIVDSLRSVGRSLAAGEQEPEIAAVLYDLKDAVTSAGGSLLLIHHCNKQGDLVGTEALSGHNAIAGSANTVLTLHYLTDAKGALVKGVPERRLFSEGRSGPGFDLVITPYGSGFRREMGHDQWQQQAREAERQQRQADKKERQQLNISVTAKAALEALTAAGDWMTARAVCDALEVPWGDRGRGGEARKVKDALQRLVDVGLAEKGDQGRETTYRQSPTRRDTLETTVTKVTSSHTKGSGPVTNTVPNTVTTVTSSHTKGSGVRDIARDSGPPQLAPLPDAKSKSLEPLRRSVVTDVTVHAPDPVTSETPCGAALSPLSRLSRCPGDPPEESAQVSLPVVITAPLVGSAGLDVINDDDPAWGKRPA